MKFLNFKLILLVIFVSVNFVFPDQISLPADQIIKLSDGRTKIFFDTMSNPFHPGGGVDDNVAANTTCSDKCKNYSGWTNENIDDLSENEWNIAENNNSKFEGAQESNGVIYAGSYGNTLVPTPNQNYYHYNNFCICKKPVPTPTPTLPSSETIDTSKKTDLTSGSAVSETIGSAETKKFTTGGGVTAPTISLAPSSSTAQTASTSSTSTPTPSTSATTSATSGTATTPSSAPVPSTPTVTPSTQQVPVTPTAISAAPKSAAPVKTLTAAQKQAINKQLVAAKNKLKTINTQIAKEKNNLKKNLLIKQKNAQVKLIASLQAKLK